MIYEINQMIDHLDEFFKGSQKECIVGGIAGTQIERFALDSALQTTEFGKILVINGCQDYIGLMKKPMQNVMFWADLFIEEMVDPLIPIDPWKPKFLNPEAEYVKRVNTQVLSMYDVIVVFNAHLISNSMLYAISENFSGKIVYVVDPMERTGSSLMWELGVNDMPVVVDHLEKVSPMIALARSSIGFDSRAVDYKVKGTLNEVSRINKRSIGKIDDKQYVTDDWELYHEVRQRQIDSPFRKNQKVEVIDDTIDVMIENGSRLATLTRGSLLVIHNANPSPLMRLRLYNSKTIYAADVTYANSNVMRPKGAIKVQPANIIMIDNFMMHRYNHAVAVLTCELPRQQRYTLLKNSNNVTIVNKMK